MSYTITYDGLWARIDPPTLPEDVEQELLSKFLWVNPLDLTDTIPLYLGNGIAYGGLAKPIAEVIRSFGCEVCIRLPDYTKQYSWEFLWEYRPLQEAAVEAPYAHRRGIVNASAGSGKTVLMAALTCKMGIPTVILVQNELPFGQVVRTLRESTTIKDIGCVGGGQETIGAVTVMMMQSAVQSIKKDPTGPIATTIRNAGALLCDECHHGVSDGYQLILSTLGKPLFILGFSATPFRGDERHELLEAYYGPSIHTISYGQAIENGILCPTTVYVRYVPKKTYPKVEIPKERVYNPETNDFIEIDKILQPWVEKKLSRDRYAMVYTDYIVNNEVRNVMGVEFARSVASSGVKTCAIIVSRISHAHNIKKLMPEAHIVISSTKPAEKARVFKEFSEKRITTIITTLMNEAVDIPSLGSVALMAGGKSASLLIQRIRSTRVHPGKLRGYVLYPYDQCEYLASHSYACSKLLQAFVGESDKNRYIIV